MKTCPARTLPLPPVPTSSLSWTDTDAARAYRQGRYAPAQCSPGDATIGARRQIELRHRRPHQTLTLRQAQCTAFCLQLAELPDLPDAHIGVTHHGLQSLATLRRSLPTSDSETPTLNITRPRIDSEDSPTLSPLSFHNPRAGLRCEYQFYRAMDPRFVSDILSPMPVHRCMASGNPHSSYRHSDGHNPAQNMRDL